MHSATKNRSGCSDTMPWGNRAVCKRAEIKVGDEWAWTLYHDTGRFGNLSPAEHPYHVPPQAYTAPAYPSFAACPLPLTPALRLILHTVPFPYSSLSLKLLRHNALGAPNRVQTRMS